MNRHQHAYLVDFNELQLAVIGHPLAVQYINGVGFSAGVTVTLKGSRRGLSVSFQEISAAVDQQKHEAKFEGNATQVAPLVQLIQGWRGGAGGVYRSTFLMASITRSS